MVKEILKPFLRAIIVLFACHTVHAQNWVAVPLVSQEILDNGNSGGEGCQVIEALECDHDSGKFLLMGTDVGGIYRSIDGGKLWSPANIGYHPRGNVGFAIDPNNNERALAIGGNSMNNKSHGIYLSTNQGASWKHVLQIGDYDGYRGFKDKVDFVAASFDEELGYSTDAYWSCPSGGIYRSTDGGENWTKVNDAYGDSFLKVHPDSGYVYVANDEGVFKSTDEAATFEQKFTGKVSGFDVVLTAPNSVFVCEKDKIYKSLDAGESFESINAQGLPDNIITLNVSPADTNHIAVCQGENSWGGPIYYSHNGGATWGLAKRSNENAFMPYNHRHQIFAWHPTNPDKVWALGGDWISSSADAGVNFEWDANGYTGVLVGGMLSFNVFNPDLLYLASQDYNGAFTKDGGTSWKYCNASGQGWGGFTYGAYAASEDILVTQVSAEWHTPGNLTISRNGGASFTKTSHICDGLEVASGDAKDPDVIYFSNYYSKNSGQSWEKMNGCQGVLIANLFGEKEVYGARATRVVVSKNKGDYWEPVVSMPNTILDIAIDHIKNRLYIVISGNRLFQFENQELTEMTDRLPKDQYNNQSLRSVAVDPNDPGIIYVAGPKNLYKTDASVKRSVDGGLTWEIITPNLRTNDGLALGDGANEVFGIRVNPATRELWATGGCYGIWKEIPENKMTLKMTSPENDTFYIYPDSVSFKAEVKHNINPISKVEFFNDDVLLASDSVAPYEFTWKDIELGSYMVFAKVTDDAGNTAFSGSVPVKMLVSQLPRVSIVSPENDAEFEFGSNIELLAEANDPDGSISRVEFFNKGTKLGEASASPFTVTIENAKAGSYSIIAIATDNSDQTVTSIPVEFNVKGEGGAIYYVEDFNDGLAQDWVPTAGTWEVVQNQFRNPTTDGGVENCIYEGTTFADYTYTVRGNPDWGNRFGVLFNYVDNQNYYLLELTVSPKIAKLIRVYRGAEKVLAEGDYTGGGQYVYVKMEVKNDGKSTTVKISDKMVFDQVPTKAFTHGKIGLHTWWNPLWFDDVVVDAKGSDYIAAVKQAAPLSGELDIHPNPSSDQIHIKLEGPGNMRNQLEVYMLSGKLVHSEIRTGNEFSLSTKAWGRPGLYIVRVSNREYSGYKKIIIQ